MAGQDFNKLWSDSIDISSGPFKFESWQKGTQLTLVKNTAYKSGPASKLDRIVFRYLAGASQFQALKSDEGQVVEPQPQVQIVDFYKDKKFKVDAGAGHPWEHIDFQQGAKAHPALKQKFVRQAIITGINRAQLREVLYVKTGPGGLGEADARPAKPHLQAVRAAVQAGTSRGGSSASGTRSRS